MTRSLRSKLLAAALVLSLTPILISCGHNDTRLLRDAAIQKAIVEAEQAQPRAQLPARCEQGVPHAEVELGMTIERLLKLEQAQLDIANDVIIDCSKFNLG